MKKLLLLVMSLVLLMAMMIPVFAADIITDGGEQSTLVKYGVSDGFTVTIPAELTLQKDAEVTQTISATNVFLEYGQKLEVTVESDNNDGTNWYLKHLKDTSKKLPYTIGNTTKGNEVTKINDTVLTVEAGDLEESSILYFNLIGEPDLAGNYQDTLKFTVTVVTPEA